MAIVEDGDINESEEENKIDVVGIVVEEEDSWDEESDIETATTTEIYERKAEELEMQIEENPFSYVLHLELLQVLSNIPGFDHWRNAFIRLQSLGPIKETLWEMRLSTEIKLAGTTTEFIDLPELFLDSCHDCYSPLILSDWCQWAVTLKSEESVRDQFKEILRKGGPDPFDGQTLWVAAADYETKLLGALKESDEKYKDQAERVLYYLEEMVSRPLLNAERGWAEFEVVALKLHDQKYVDKVKKQHDISQEFLQHLIEYEEKIQTISDVDEKCKVYLEYIAKVKELAKDKDTYEECDTNGVLRVLYDRATCECADAGVPGRVFAEWARLGRSGRAWERSCRAVCRRRPQLACGWTGCLQAYEEQGEDFVKIKTLFESALGSGLESFNDTQKVWLAYLEYLRRSTDLSDEAAVDRLRKTFRLSWDSLAEQYGEASNQSEVPLFWARLEYDVLGSPREGKEIFEELFKYGTNKTLSKFWETLLHLEAARHPRVSYNKYRDLLRRAVSNVADYPHTVANMWIAYERNFGTLRSEMEANDFCEDIITKWHINYQLRKGLNSPSTKKQTFKGPKQNKEALGAAKSVHNKKANGKRKLDSKDGEGGKKKKVNEVGKGKGKDQGEKGKGKGEQKGDNKTNKLKRTHEEMGEGSSTKRSRQEDSKEYNNDPQSRDACTLFVSNLDFKVDEDKLREKLSEFGEIVSMRVKAGVKTFGGSICYCHYQDKESVDKAVAHDRAPLGGRPMFLSRFGKRPQFRYSSVPEKHKLFVRDLPRTITDAQLRDIFDKFGELKDIRIVTFKDGTPKGLAYIEYRSEQSAAAALTADGTRVDGRPMRVALSAPPAKQSDVDVGAATTSRRRTQLSSFIPSVLQRPSTSANPPANATDKQTDKPKSNSDFRDMLLNNK